MRILFDNNLYISDFELTNNAKSRCEALFIRNSNGIDQKEILDGIISYQSTADNQPLSGIAIDLPYNYDNEDNEYSGTTDELSAYSTYQGVNVSGDIEGKPVLRGTWKFTDYVDDAIIATLSAYFEPQCPALSALNPIDWSSFLIQCLDSTKPNYNPAVSIVLNNNGKGSLNNNTNRFSGKWWITYSNAATNISTVSTWFKQVDEITDSNKIVDKTTVHNYNLTDMTFLSACTSLTSLDVSGVAEAFNLTSIAFPNQITEIPSSYAVGCSSLTDISFPTSLVSIKSGAFKGCTDLEEVSFTSYLTSIEASAFYGDTDLHEIDFNSCFSLKRIENNAFEGCTHSGINLNFTSSNTQSMEYADITGFSNLSSVTVSGVTTFSNLII